MDSKRNFTKKRIIPLLVPREYIVPPLEPVVFLPKLKMVVKRLRDGSTPVERHFTMNPPKKHQEFGTRVQGEISKNLKNST